MNKLTKKQKLYIEYSLQHPLLTDTQISKDLNITCKQICVWKKDPEFVAELDSRLKEQWNGYAKEAQEVLHRILLTARDDIAIKAATYILDSTGYKATDKVELDVDGGVDITIDYGED